MGILGDFFGSSARKDLKSARRRSNEELDEGYAGANDYYDQAYSEFTPYAQQGAEGATAYRNALLGSPEQKQALYDNYTNDPGMQGMLGLQSNALLRRLNAGGSATGGGKLALAGARVAQEGYGGFLDRLSGLGQQGLNATTNQSNIRMGQGDLRFGLGATKAGSEINFGNAMAQSRSTGINNLLNTVGTAAKAYTAFSDARLKRDVVRDGALPSGLPTYTFKYHWSDTPHKGVLAQEALHYAPAAVSEDPATGYLVVDYSQIS